MKDKRRKDGALVGDASSRYVKEILGRGWRDWSGHGWFVRTIGLGALAFVIGYAFDYLRPGPRAVPPHPWAGNVLAGTVAAVLWGILTLLVSILRASVKLLRERDAAIETSARIQGPELPKPSLDKSLRLVKEQLETMGSGTSLEVDLQLKNDGQFNGRVLLLWYTGPVLAVDTLFREYLSLNMAAPLGDGGYAPAAGPSSNCVRLRLRESLGKPIKKVTVRVFSHVPVSLLRAEWQ